MKELPSASCSPPPLLPAIIDKSGEGAALGGIYSVTLAALGASGSGGGNERLLFKTRMKLGRSLLAQEALGELAGLVAQLEATAAGPQGGPAAGLPGGSR